MSKMDIFKPKTFVLVSLNLNFLEPLSIKQALCSPEWNSSIQVEFDTLVKNQNWTLVPTRANRQVMGNKSVFRINKLPYDKLDK